MLILVVGGLLWGYDRLVLSDFARFTFDNETQSNPLTVLKIVSFFDYVEPSQSEQRVLMALTRLGEPFGAQAIEVNSLRLREYRANEQDLERILIFGFDQGIEYSKFASSIQYRDFMSSTANLVFSSVDVVLNESPNFLDHPTAIVMLVDVRVKENAFFVESEFLKLPSADADLLLSKEVLIPYSGSSFTPNLAVIFGFENPEGATRWFQSIGTQSRLSLLDRKIGEIRTYLLQFGG